MVDDHYYLNKNMYTIQSVSTSMVRPENIVFNVKFVPTVCVFDIISKRNKSFCCLNHIFRFSKSSQVLIGKILKYIT